MRILQQPIVIPILIATFLINFQSVGPAQSAKEQLLGLLEIPNVTIEATAKSVISPEFMNEPMYAELTDPELDMRIRAHYFDEALFYKISTDAGETVVYYDIETNATRYWFTGTNKVFISYPEEGISADTAALSPYQIFYYLSRTVNSDQDTSVTSSPDGPGFIITNKINRTFPGIPGEYFAITHVANEGNRVTSTTLVNTHVVEDEVAESMVRYRYEFSKPDSKYPGLSRLVKYETLDPSPESGAETVERRIVVDITSMEPIPETAKMEDYLTALTEGMHPVDHANMVYGIPQPPDPKPARSTWPLWVAAGAIFITAISILFTRRRR